MDSTKYFDQTFFGDASVWPLTIINSVHVYHMIGGFGLTAADYFHHLLFVPALGFPGQVYQWGALANFQAFFISGLPGGLDYFMLGLIRVGRLSALFEKRVNAIHLPHLLNKNSRLPPPLLTIQISNIKFRDISFIFQIIILFEFFYHLI